MAASPVPFERFAQFRRYMSLGFHPGGDLFYTTDLTGQFNLWRQPVEAGGRPGYPRLLTAYADRPVREFAFPEDGRSVFFTADQNGDEFYQVHRLWFDRGITETITQAPDVQHFLGGGSILAPNGDLLLTDNGRARQDIDVVVRNLRTGTSSRPFPEGWVWAGPRFDPSRRKILAIQYTSNSDLRTFVLDRKRGTVSEVLPHSEEASVTAVDWTGDGRGIFLLSDLGSEFKALVLHYPATGKTHVLAAPKADIEYVTHSPRSRTLAYVANQSGYSVVYAGRAGGKFQRRPTPKGAIPFGIWGSQFEISSDGRFVAALWGDGTAPPEVLWIPLGPGKPRPVTDGMVGGVPGGPLRPPKLVSIPAPQGRAVPAFYYLPSPTPKGRMPAMLSIHGGPNAQERPDWRYSGLHQYLNSCGIAVVAPNVRGSSGYGKSYLKVLDRDWGGVDLEDLRACAEWMRNRPEFDPDRLAVFGGSFGGFATLSCLARLPEYWKVGVDIFGPSNLVSFLSTIPPSWKKGFVKMLGDPEKDRDFLLSRSPITYLSQVRAEMMVIQGGMDPRVVRAESDQLVERLRSQGRKVEYLVFEDEGHGFTRQANQLKANSAVASFLVERLMGGAASH